jgi:hypothetical protein
MQSISIIKDIGICHIQRSAYDTLRLRMDISMNEGRRQYWEGACGFATVRE